MSGDRPGDHDDSATDMILFPTVITEHMLSGSSPSLQSFTLFVGDVSSLSHTHNPDVEEPGTFRFAQTSTPLEDGVTRSQFPERDSCSYAFDRGHTKASTWISFRYVEFLRVWRTGGG